MSSPYPPDEDVIKNATVAIEEIRGHIEHQSKDAESVDTKGAAILTLTVGAATFIASRVSAVNTDAQRLSVLVSAFVFGILVVCLFQSLRPREVFSYSADPRRLVELSDRYPHKTVMLWMADSLVAARETNVTFLAAKQGWYQRALRAMAAAGIAAACMIQTGAIT